ncbi:MAG: radical SAM protein [Oscillospiraceae bacterium]|jgi:hypothetical protein|nr:radical SAM protein [Oscillospiraceae bacterium]
MSEMQLCRYAKITEKLPREFCLLQGTGCRWGKCTFCDYHLDRSSSPFETNRAVLSNITGEFGVLDVINSGSCIELDEQTLDLIAEIVKEKHIHTVWVEAHYMYAEKLADFAKRFGGVTVKFRTGIETFDPKLRKKWQKGTPEDITPQDIAKYFNGVCLLFAVEGQTKEGIARDIEIALKHFEYFSLNAFVENTTALRRDAALLQWFLKECYPALKNNPKAEVLLNNTDLGVG